MVYGGRAYKDFFDYLKANSFLGLPSTVMLVAPEADAICAYKMLDILFRSENICYQCLAVTCDQDLVKCAKAVGADSIYKTIILINCGGRSNLNIIFNLRRNQHLKIYIIDSHRPYKCDNLFGYDQITILDDEPNQRALRQLSDAYYMVKVRSHENGPINDGDGRKSKRQKTEGEQEVGLNIQTDEEETRKRKGDAKKITDDYEKKPAYYSKSVAGVTYSLAGEISRTFNERHPNAKNLLWLAMVGLTSQFISNLIDQTQYEEQWKFFNEQLKVIKPSNAEIKPMHTITATNGSDTDIRSIMEYRFILLGHWTLYDSAKNSELMFSIMKLYTERGEEKWKEKLAEMGIPLKSCSRDFIAVRTEVGPRLKGKLKELIDEHSRKDIEFPSFARTFGFKKTLTASDMAYTLSALLETPREKAESHGCRINPLDEDSDLDNKSLWNFYTASDALDMSRIDEIVTGIELSKKIQEDIASTCKRLLKTRNAVSKIRNQLFFVELDTGHDWLARPNMLRKFSMFMARAYKKPKERNLPMIVAVPSTETSEYLIAGVVAGQSTNDFTAFFRLLSRDPLLKNKVRFPTFDQDILVLSREDYPIFKRAMEASLRTQNQSP